MSLAIVRSIGMPRRLRTPQEVEDHPDLAGHADEPPDSHPDLR